MKRSLRGPVALGAGVTMTLALISPAASAAGATSTAAAAPADVQAVSAATAPTPSASDAISRLERLYPANWKRQQKRVDNRIDIEDSPFREALERAINPDDYECGPTDFDAYIDGLLAGMTADDLKFLFNSGVLEFPTYEALIFGRTGERAYALRDFRWTLKKTFRQAKGFWDIDASDIQLHAMRGDMLLDTERVARLLVALYGFTEADAGAYAAAVADVIASTPAFDDGDNPIFTLNAYAFSGEGDPDPLFASTPDKLVFGDGFLDAANALGIAKIGVRAVLGHEYGHHIQYEQNLFESSLPAPEATRRTELMADSFATYFATHNRGLGLQNRRVMAAQRTFFLVGDCQFDSPGHHGTPNQRLRAAKWGTELAEHPPRWRILGSLTVAELFEEKLPEFVAPDAEGRQAA